MLSLLFFELLQQSEGYSLFKGYQFIMWVQNKKRIITHLQFDELETNGEYVAVESGPYINVPYGQTRFTLRGKVCFLIRLSKNLCFFFSATTR